VEAQAVQALRLAVLRPGGAPEDAVWAGDEDPRAGHFAVLGPEGPAGAAVGVASVVPEAHPGGGAAGDWRVRGMATAPAARGQGVGAALLEACVAHAAGSGARRVWCHARVRAVSLYERAGFACETGEFDVAGLGPHRRMALVVA
jgi:GNAT superfamily N-acetyltransferase